jgi:hypothetical protein
MKLMRICFELWKELMTYDGRDPKWDIEDYRGIFWDYLNYSYIRKEWSIKSEWRWGDE